MSPTLSDQTKKHLLMALRVDARATRRRPLETPGPPKRRKPEKNLFFATKNKQTNKKHLLTTLRVDARAIRRRPLETPWNRSPQV